MLDLSADSDERTLLSNEIITPSNHAYINNKQEAHCAAAGVRVGPKPADTLHHAKSLLQGASGKPDQSDRAKRLLGSVSRNYKLTIKRVRRLSRPQGCTGSMWCVPTVIFIYVNT